MHGTDRKLVNPPVSSREAFAALDAEHVLKSYRYAMIEAQGVHHEPGALTVTTYDAITLDRAVVAIHVVGPADRNGEAARFVLWFDPAEATLFAQAVMRNARLVQQHEASK